MSVPFGSDPWLDARLRNVQLPAGMLARLNQLPKEAGDEPATSAIGSDSVAGPKLFRPNQPIPLGPELSDEQMDAALVDVPLPSGMRQRLERIGFERRPRFSGRQLALAASVLVAVGVAYVSRSMFFSPASNQESPGPVVAVDPGRKVEIANVGSNELPVDDSQFAASHLEEDEFKESIEELRRRLVKESENRIFLPDQIVAPAPNPVRPSKEALFGGGDAATDTVPEFDVVDFANPPRGVSPPLVKGFDIRFLAKHGQNPFVVPAAHQDLQSLRVPLVTSSASYQKAWQSLAARKLPMTDEVRIEEFLAAVDYGFSPATPGSLALRTAAGPSPFSQDAGMRLLQVAVQAGPLASQSRPGTMLTVVVDTSTSMRRDGRLAMIRRALADMASQLTNSDRLSLVASGNGSKLLVEAAGVEQMPRIVAAIESLQPERVTNVGAGLEAAYMSTLERPISDGESRRIVLVTDGLADLTDDAIGRIESLVSEGAVKGVRLQVMQVGGTSTERDQRALQRVVAAGGGQTFEIGDAHAARFAMLETLSGRKQVVAREASLRITFNPKVVAAYRLLGHETVTLTGSTAAATAIDIRAEEAATALVELRLNPQGGDDVATVELSWSDTASGEQRSAKQRISRLQFAKSFAESPLSLQAAAIVGHSAEVLRGSYFTAGNRALGPVLDLAAQASPLAMDRPEMRVFLSFVEQAEKVRARGAKRP